MLLGILGASLIENLFTSQGQGTIRLGEEKIRGGQDF